MDFSGYGFCKSDGNIPITHLDYQYIENCKDASYLEKIVKILRSGEEGNYPDLTNAAERRLAALNPASKVLLKASPAANLKEMPAQERGKLLGDLENWMSDISELDKTLSSRKDNKEEADGNLPPVRHIGKFGDSCKTEVKATTDNKAPVIPRDPGEWNKFDIDKELEKIDVESKEEKSTASKERISKIEDDVTVAEGLPKAELISRALNEKNKGNEAFKSALFSEALTYYNRSLSLFPLADVYNNRAITFIKLEKYDQAIKDCERVLKLESSNLKAYLRRGCAYQGLREWRKAEEDFQNVLQIEPGNKRAQTLLEEVRGQMKTVIDDDESFAARPDSDVNEPLSKGDELIGNLRNLADAKKGSNDHKEAVKPSKGTRLKIMEIDGTEDVSGNSLKSEASCHGQLSARDDELKEENDKKNNDIVETTNKSDEGGQKKKGKKINIVEIEDEDELKETVNGHEAALEVEKVPNESHGNDSVASESAFKAGGKNSHSFLLESRQSNSETKTDPNSASTSSSLQESTPVVEVEAEIPANVIVLKDEGNGLFKAGNYASALQKYSLALAALSTGSYFGSKAILLSNRAVCKLKVGDCKGCIEDATQSIQLKASAKAYLRRATAEDLLERYEEAYVDYQVAVRLDPSTKSAWDALSRLLPILKNKHGANWRDNLPTIPSLQLDLGSTSASSRPSEPVNTSPKQKDASTSEPKSTEMAKEKREETSEKKFSKAKAEGNNLVQKGKFKEAIERYTECIKLLPSEVASYTNRALCYLKTNEPKKAIEDCKAALEIQPTNIKALFRSAQAKKTLNQLRDCIADLVALLKIEPDNGAAKKELEGVKEAWRKELRLVQARQGGSDKGQEKINTERKSQDSQSGSNSDGLRRRKGKDTAQCSKVTSESTKAPKEDKQEASPADCGTTRAGDLRLSKVTPFEFWRAWNCVKKKGDTKSYAQILSQIQPSQLGKVLSNKLDGDVILTMVLTVRNHFLSDELVFTGFRFLEELAKVPRFKMALLFHSAQDMSLIRRTIIELEKKCLENKKVSLSPIGLANLKRNYEVL